MGIAGLELKGSRGLMVISLYISQDKFRAYNKTMYTINSVLTINVCQQVSYNLLW